MEKVLIITGPTAVGKSDYAIEIAKKLNGEIISADSMQIYKGLDIGSGKITHEEMQGVPHHLIDIKEPLQEFSVYEFVELTKNSIKEILARNRLPIIVGGTGLYIKALVENYDFACTNKDSKIREKYQLLADEKGNDYLYNLLLSRSEVVANKISVADRKRIIRALEILDNSGVKEINSQETIYDYKVFALNMPREQLYEKINLRVDKMFTLGLENEVRLLYNKGLNSDCQSMKAIGYKEFIPYFEGKMTLNEVKELIKQHSRNYAKRQLTWLRSMPYVKWLDVLIKNDVLNEIYKECERA